MKPPCPSCGKEAAGTVSDYIAEAFNRFAGDVVRILMQTPWDASTGRFGEIYLTTPRGPFTCVLTADYSASSRGFVSLGISPGEEYDEMRATEKHFGVDSSPKDVAMAIARHIEERGERHPRM